MFGAFLKSLGHIATAAGGAAGAARTLFDASDRLPLEQRRALERTNHRGEKVSLVSGPILAAAATGSAVVTAGDRRLASAALVAGLGAGAAGYYDDIVGARPDQRGDKGFRGHLSALKEGRVTSGLVKIAAIGGSGLAAGIALHRKPVDVLLTAGVVAGMANLVNLLDLRPGRALKAGLGIGAPQLLGRGRGVAAATMGAAAALLPEDLNEQTMLGDAGANSLGALLGVSLAANTGRFGKIAALAGLVGLTAASEKVSFTKVIESTPGLRQLDGLGRRPPLVNKRREEPSAAPSADAAGLAEPDATAKSDAALLSS